MHNLLPAIRQHAFTQPEKPALASDGGVIPYGDLPGLISQRARRLTKSRCRVAGLSMENGPEWILWDLACVEARVVCVPLPGFFTQAQRNNAIKAAGADILITESGLFAIDAGAAQPLPERTSKVTFTSGSTGDPKGVCLSQAGLETVAQSLLEVIGVQHAGRHFSVLPLCVLLENVAGIYTALLAGCTCCVFSPASIGLANPFAPDFEKLAHSLRAYRATSTILVPELLRGLVAQLAKDNSPLPALTFAAVGGAKVDPSLLSAARRLGLSVYEGYGLTECGSVVSLNTPGADRSGTSGRLLPHVQARLSAAGEIIVENPLFLGYTDSTRQMPFQTGDIGDIDAGGYISIKGRAKNILVTSFGRNISPEWVESVLLAQPEILQAIVYGDARPRPDALLVPSSPQADIAAAVARANSLLPEYTRVAAFHAVPPFTPADGLLTANGRLRRAEILPLYATLTKTEDKHAFLRSTGS